MNKLLIFDVDGVLEKRNLLSQKKERALQLALAKKLNLNKEKTKQKFLEAQKSLPLGKNSSSVYIYSKAGLTRKEFFKVSESVDPRKYIKKDQETIDVVKELSSRNKIIAYSNSSIKATIQTLESLGIIEYISKFYSSEDFDESKPSIGVLKKIIAQQKFKVQNIFSIGNSIEKDLLPAYQLGITTILFDPKGKFGKRKGVDYIIKDLKEIIGLV